MIEDKSITRATMVPILSSRVFQCSDDHTHLTLEKVSAKVSAKGQGYSNVLHLETLLTFTAPF